MNVYQLWSLFDLFHLFCVWNKPSKVAVPQAAHTQSKTVSHWRERRGYGCKTAMAERFSHLPGLYGPLVKSHAAAGKLLPKNFLVGSQGNFRRVVKWDRLGFMGRWSWSQGGKHPSICSPIPFNLLYSSDGDVYSQLYYQKVGGGFVSLFIL